MSAKCENCGLPGFRDACRKCGFKVVKMMKLDPVYLLFCLDCGCHYTNGCPNHSFERQINVVK